MRVCLFVLLVIFVSFLLVGSVNAECNCKLDDDSFNVESDVEGNPDFEVVDFNSFNESINNTNDLMIGALGSAYIKIYSKYCYGYKVYVNGKYKLTENGDGYCAFYIPCGQTVTIKLVKDGCSYQKTRYIYCGYTYRWEIDENWCKNCNGGRSSNEVKFKCVVTGLGFCGEFCGLVEIKEVIFGPVSVGQSVTVQYSSGLGHKGYYDSNIDVGDYIEVYGVKDYDTGYIILKNSYHYAKKISSSSKCCPCEVYTDKSVYCPWEPVYFTVKFCKREPTPTPLAGSISGSSYSYCDPSSFRVYLYKPDETQDLTCNFRKVSTGVYKFKGLIGCPPGKRTIKVVKSGCDPIYASYNVKAGWLEIIPEGDKLCCGYKVYIDGYYFATDNGDCYAKICLCPGWHTIKLVKNGVSKEFSVYIYNNQVTRKYVSMDWCAKPDLIIDKIWWDGNPKKGDNVKIHVRVKNAGNKDAGSSYTKLEVDGESLGIKYTSSLSVGETETLTFNWKADRCGDVTVKAIADWYDDVDESNERNNEKSAKLHLRCPDLIVDEIIFNPLQPAYGDNVEISVKIKNIGDAKAPSSYTALILGNVITAYTPPIPASSYKVVKFNIKSGCGDHEVKAKADYYDDVDEHNEYNNEKSKTLHVRCPDLIVKEIDLPSISVDETRDILIKVKNIGDADASTFDVALFVDGKLIGKKNTNLKAGEEKSLNFEYKATSCGDKDVKAIVDYSNKIHESNEYNNDETAKLHVKCPDLIVEDIYWTPEKPLLGEPITIHVRVKNKGDGDAVNPFNVLLEVEGVKLVDKVNRLNAGSSITLSFSSPQLFCGSHDVYAKVDASNSVKETNEYNNDRTESVRVYCPDLTIDEIKVYNAKVQWTASIVVRIKNQGDGDARNFNLKIYVNDVLKFSDSINYLKAGSTTSRTVRFKVDVCGDLKIKAVVDEGNAVKESREDNNVKTKTINIDCPDIAIKDIKFKTTPEKGKTTWIVVSVENKGNADTKGFYVHLFVDGKELPKRFTSLRAKETKDVTFLWRAVCGKHEFKAIADLEGKVIESNERNNESTKKLEVLGKLTKVEIEGDDEIGVGEKKRWKAYACYECKKEDVTNKAKWSSSDSDILESRGNGWFKGLEKGNTKISAEYEGKVGYKYIKVISRLDLTVEDIYWEKLKEGESNPIFVKVRSNEAVKDVKVKLYVDDKFVGSATVDLEKDITKHVGIFWKAEYGVHNVKAVVDPDNKIEETNEKNNETTKQVKVLPDLMISSIKLSNTNPKVGENVKIDVEIKNIGYASSPAFWVTYKKSKNSYESKSVNKILPPGKSATVTFYWKAECGIHELQFYADAKGYNLRGYVDELNENNNARSTVVIVKCVKKYVDLMINDQDITWEVENGNDVYFKVKVRNNGNDPSGAFDVALFIDNRLISKKRIDSLKANSETTVEFMWDAEGESVGDHEVKVVADLNGEVIETNEKNNVAKTKITCVDIEVIGVDTFQSVKNFDLIIGKPFEVWVWLKIRGGKLVKPQFDVDIGIGSKVDINRVSYDKTLEDGATAKKPLVINQYINSPGEYNLNIKISNTYYPKQFPDPNLSNNHKTTKILARDTKIDTFKLYFKSIDIPKSKSVEVFDTAMENIEFLSKVYPIELQKVKVIIDYQPLMSPIFCADFALWNESPCKIRENSPFWYCKLEKLSKDNGADIGVGVVSKDWWHDWGTRGTSWETIHGVLITNYHDIPDSDILSHEIGHIYGLCEEYKLNSNKQPVCYRSNINGPGAVPGETYKIDFCDKDGCYLDFSENFDINCYGRLTDKKGKRCFMGVGDDSIHWICRNCYEHLFRIFVGEPSTSALSAQSLQCCNHITQMSIPTQTIQTMQKTDVLFVSGIVYRNGTASFYKIEKMRNQIPDKLYPGNYSIVLLDSNNRVLSEYKFSVSFWSEMGETNVTGFAFTVPWVEGTSKVQLKHFNEIKDEYILSKHSPTVSILYPRGGEFFTSNFTVKWQAYDADGDDLTYTVLYTNDDKNWNIIALDINQTSLTVDKSIIGGGSCCRIKVIASDGANTGEAISNCFAVETNPPKAVITSPQNNSEFLQWDEIEFSGYGYDMDDGFLPDDNLVWISDLDGVIGYGSSFTNSSLSTGTHNITLIAKDSENKTAIESITIKVHSRIPNACFTIPTKPAIYKNITFDASCSSDYDGNLTKYIWNFGDGEKLTTNSSVISHRYTTGGNYTVTLTVVDDDGFTNTISKTISVGFPSVNVSVKSTKARKGEIKVIPITIQNAVNLTHAYLQLKFNPEILHVLDVNGTKFDTMIMKEISNTTGFVRYAVKQSNGSVSGNVILANLIVKAVGNVNSSSELNLTAILQDGFNNLISTNIKNGTFEIASELIPLPNSITPKDIDNDGLYEDLNGNGRLDYNDVVVFHRYLDWIKENEPVECFDFNKDGVIDEKDVDALAAKIK